MSIICKFKSIKYFIYTCNLKAIGINKNGEILSHILKLLLVKSSGGNKCLHIFFKSLKENKNRLLFVIMVFFTLVVVSLNFVINRLNSYDGFYTYHKYTFMIVCALFVIFIIRFLPLYDTKKLNLYSFLITGLYTVLMLVYFSSSFILTYRHFEYSVLQKDVRFEIENVSLDAIDKIDKDNYILYIGDSTDNLCDDTYDYLNKSSLDQPIRVSYYDTNENNDEMTSILDKYEVSEVPAVVFILDGKHSKTIYYDEILSSFNEYVHIYKKHAIYFNKEL